MTKCICEGKNRLKWSLIVRGGACDGIFQQFESHHLNVLLLYKLIKLSSLQNIIRKNKCYFYGNSFNLQSKCSICFVLTQVRNEWELRSGHEIQSVIIARCAGLLSGCQSPRDRYRNRIREFVDCEYQFPSLFVKSLPPLYWARQMDPRSCDTSHGSSIVKRRIFCTFYFR